MEESSASTLDLVLDTVANDKRRAIIDYLALQPATIGQLARVHGLSLPAIHKHIRKLESANLIIRKKVGRTNFVAFNPGALSLAQDWIMQYKTSWGSPDASFENYISRMRE